MNNTVSHVLLKSKGTLMMLLEFQLNDVGFFLSVAKESDDKFHPLAVMHRDETFKCPFCRKKGVLCDVLNDNILSLFHQAIEHPAVRLEWLYIDYIGKDDSHE